MLIRPLTEQRIAEMRETIRSFNKLLEAADSLAKKPRLAEIHAESRAVVKLREARATSINDIIDRLDTAYLLEDPIWGPRICEWSDELNSSKKGT